MKKEYAEQIVNQYINRIYSFVKQRVSNEQDIFDVSQEICLNIYKALCVKTVNSMDGFIWTVARNTLINYYRGKQKSYFNVSIENSVEELKDGKKTPLDEMIDKENYEKIRREIAYLSKMQRKILIMYYYEERKQSEIAGILGIPLGTVKWHLNVAKSELKKGMEKVRDIKDLKFDPIEFSIVGLSGGTGEMGAAINFFRTALSQNIVYSVCRRPLTIEEIADSLGVSPVYVESELDFLEEYSLVVKNKNKYMANILIDEPTEETIKNQKKLYENVSSLIANELYDKIIEGRYLDSDEIYGPDNDRNFIMWSLIFYLLAWVESDYFEERISFEEAATIRADGGKNIINCSVKNRVGEEYLKTTKMDQFCGPCWNGDDEIMLWLIDGDWTERRVGQHYGGPNIVRDLNLLKRFARGESLSVDDYTFLLEKHYIKKSGDDFEFAIVVLRDGDIKKSLFEQTKQIKNKVLEQVKDQINAYRNQVLANENLPEHLRTQQEYCNQYLFHSDGWFMLYAKAALVNSGRLKPIEGVQKYSVTEMIII
ncbi:MAG: sigma-70 family RNA polymerase sigma factor [Eubacterium sp.]